MHKVIAAYAQRTWALAGAAIAKCVTVKKTACACDFCCYNSSMQANKANTMQTTATKPTPFTAADIAAVIEHNKTAGMFYTTSSGRTQWYLRNMHVTQLNQMLSRPLQTADDFAQLKRQVRKQIAN